MNPTVKFLIAVLIVAAAFLLLRHGQTGFGATLRGWVNFDVSQ